MGENWVSTLPKATQLVKGRPLRPCSDHKATLPYMPNSQPARGVQPPWAEAFRRGCRCFRQWEYKRKGLFFMPLQQGTFKDGRSPSTLNTCFPPLCDCEINPDSSESADTMARCAALCMVPIAGNFLFPAHSSGLLLSHFL